MRLGNRGVFLLVGAILLTLPGKSWGQRAWNWRVYALADGLAESACVSITVTPQGKVVARHLNQSISELDGYTVTNLPAPDAGNSRVYESPGGQLWSSTSAGLQELRDGRWVFHPMTENPAEFTSALSRLLDPIPLCPVRQGQVIFLRPDQLLEFDAEDPDHPRTSAVLSADRTRLQRFTGMVSSRDSGLWITGGRGLLKVPAPLRNLNQETNWQQYMAPDSLQLQNLRDAHDDGEDGVTAIAESGTNHSKVLAHFSGKEWRVEAELPQRIRHAWCSCDQACWAASVDGLFQWDKGRREFVESEEIAARQYFDVGSEPGGGFWLATSEGLFRYAPLIWRAPSSASRASAPIVCLAVDPERLWFVSGNVLRCLRADNREQEYPLSSFAIGGEEAPRALYALKNGTVLLEAGEQLFQYRTFASELNLKPIDHRPGKLKPLGLLSDGTLCFQFSGRGSPGRDYRLESYDGVGFKSLPTPAPDLSPGTNLTAVLAAQGGVLWLGGENGTAWYHDGNWRVFTAADKSVPLAPLGFAEMPDGKVWCATQDRIWEFDGRNWSAVRGGFDRINALARTRDGSVWVASNSGLHRLFQGAWVENGLEEGLPSPVVRQLQEDARGRLWAGTTHGLSVYHPEGDVDPPVTSIQALSDKEKRVPEGGTISLSFSGLDRWKQTPRSRLLYSYRLDERDWSPFQPDNSVSFADLPAGKHYFQARTMDRNCNIDPKPARVEFAIVLPWYKESRLVAIALAGLVGALFFAGLAFNRHRRLVHSYAEVEQKVADRTRELEQANRALVHSQKMNALGTLAAGIAHDFNNILSIIKGSAQIIEDNLEDRRKVSIRVDRIKTAVEQGAGIVKAMLGFSRDSDHRPALCDVNAVVEETLKLLGDRFLREVQVSFEPGPELPQVTCSRDFVQQILLNLIFNAAESMGKPKRIVLATQLRTDPLPAGSVLKPLETGRYIAISVQDFGCGIPAENLPRIFEPFFTTKALSVRRGTGLGLSMVYELAKKMDAGLAVGSVVSRGSNFTLILPVRAETTNAE